MRYNNPVYHLPPLCSIKISEDIVETGIGAFVHRQTHRKRQTDRQTELIAITFSMRAEGSH